MKVTDTKTKKTETVLETTSSSYLVTQTKLTKKGINCTQWFFEEDFNKRFKKIDNETN